MGKKLRKVLASCLALSMCVSMLSVAASAADIADEQPGTGTVEVETSAGKYKDVEVTITFDEKTGNTNYTAEDVDTGDGIVDYNGVSNKATGESESEYTVNDGNYHAEGGSEITVEKGEGASKITVDVPLTSEDDPETEATENQNTVEKVTPEKVTGDTKDSPSEGDYDYTKTTTSSQVTVTTNEITVTETQKVVDKDGNVIDSSDLDYVNSTVTPQGGENENDLIYFEKPGAGTPDATTDPNYDPNSTEWGYMFESTGILSQYWPAFVTTNPDAGNGNNTVVYTHTYVDENGDEQTKTYYLYKKFDNTSQLIQNSFDSLYVDGEEVSLGENSVTIDDIYIIKNTGFGEAGPNQTVTIEDVVPTTWTMASQFVLVDMETGEKITTYCADFNTPTQAGFRYNIENLEDADYYSEEEAAMIRSIAANGYWGVEGTEAKSDADGNPVLDDNGDPVMVPKSGSLEAMKEMLLASGQFSEEEMELLTDGIALTATQMAIWTYSNKMEGIEFVNAHYTRDYLDHKEEGHKDNTIISSTGGSALTGGKPGAAEGTDRDAGTDLLYKVYEYLRNLEPTTFEGNTTTANTIINADNFLKDMSVTVMEKAEDHDNNTDNDDTNDAYVTNLTFALVVTPDKDGDDLVVKVYGADGNELASGRIAGDLKEGETYVKYDEGTGNYFFEDIVMVEGEQNFNITLEGIQNLKEGVYLYTSEVVAEKDEAGNVVDETSSQTMVGIATGDHAVDVSMNLNFELSVEDEIVVTEHVWRRDWVDSDGGGSNPPSGGSTPPSGGETPPAGVEIPPEEVIEIPEEDIPLVNVEQEEIEEIPEDDIPLADVPKTGDASALWMLMSALSGSGLLGLAVLEKKRKED